MTDLTEGSQIGPYPYRIVRRLGHRQGAMADVYLASVDDQRPAGPADRGRAAEGNLVAIKITRAGQEHSEFYRATLENEVERLRRLKHPGIVRLYPVQKHGLRNLPYMAQAGLPGKPWFSVMEYLAGDSLGHHLKQTQILEIGLALEIVRSLAVTLDYLHNLRQVHLDIKPENILFREPLQPDQEPQPVLIDFGIARTVGQAGLEAGTLQWSPPERVRQVRGEVAPELLVRPHPSMDIYALGMVLYAMIAGRLPYSERSGKGITTAILEGNPTAPSVYQPLVQRELDELILMALARDPGQRPTADEMARALEEIAIRLGYRSYYGARAVPVESTTRAKGAGRSKAWIATGALAGVVLLETAFIALRWPLPPLNTSPDAATAPPPTAVTAPPPAATALPAVLPSATPSPAATPVQPTQTPASTATAAPSTTSTAEQIETSTPVPTWTPTASPTATRPPTATPTATNIP